MVDVRRGAVRQTLLPIGRHQAALGQHVDVVGQGQRHHVGFQPVEHRTRLLS